MMPVVTVPSRPSGDPTATTSWPTRRFADEPRAIGVSPETPSARTTAISLDGSAPTTVNGAVRPSAKVTVEVVDLAGTPPFRSPGQTREYRSAVLRDAHDVAVGQD